MGSPDLGKNLSNLLGSQAEWGSERGGRRTEKSSGVMRCLSDVVVLRRTQERFVSWGHASVSSRHAVATRTSGGSEGHGRTNVVGMRGVGRGAGLVIPASWAWCSSKKKSKKKTDFLSYQIL